MTCLPLRVLPLHVLPLHASPLHASPLAAITVLLGAVAVVQPVCGIKKELLFAASTYVSLHAYFNTKEHRLNVKGDRENTKEHRLNVKGDGPT